MLDRIEIEELFRRAGLNEREKYVLYERHGKDRFNADIGREFGQTSQNMSRIEAAAEDAVRVAAGVSPKERTLSPSSPTRATERKTAHIASLKEMIDSSDPLPGADVLADQMGVTTRTIYNYLDTLGVSLKERGKEKGSIRKVPAVTNRKRDANIAAITSMAASGEMPPNIADLAKELGVSQRTVYNYINLMGTSYPELLAKKPQDKATE